VQCTRHFLRSKKPYTAYTSPTWGLRTRAHSRHTVARCAKPTERCCDGVEQDQGAEEAFMGPRESCHVSFGRPSPVRAAPLLSAFLTDGRGSRRTRRRGGRNARRAEEAAAAMAAAMDQEHVFGSVELGQQWAEHAAAWERFGANPPDDITVRMRMRSPSLTAPPHSCCAFLNEGEESCGCRTRQDWCWLLSARGEGGGL